jgi:N-acetyl-gamma-glutamylphosphate reductase
MPAWLSSVQEVIKKLPSTLKVVDLSADFRLKDPALYAQWWAPAAAAAEQRMAAARRLGTAAKRGETPLHDSELLRAGMATSMRPWTSRRRPCTA